MRFETKNNFIVGHKHARHFDADRALFVKECPDHRLHGDLKRVNDFNRHTLDGKLLYELLDKVSPADILKNRETFGQEPDPKTELKPKAAAKTEAAATDPKPKTETETAAVEEKKSKPKGAKK